MANLAAGPATAASCKFRSLSWQVIAPAIYFSMLVCAAPCSVANETPETKIELDLAALLANTLREQGPSYRPRTEHLNVDGSPQYTNRLLLETSPYLIQHAHNLVNWFPWGTAAFAKARREDKLIFLSIGYSTCHWCHVMKKRVSITSRLRNFSTTILLR